MDKQLKKVKTQFENNIPASFTEKDKQLILSQIKYAKEKDIDQKRTRHVYLTPKVWLPFVIGGALLFCIILIANILPLSNFSSEKNDRSAGSEMYDEASEFNVAMDQAESSDQHTEIIEDKEADTEEEASIESNFIRTETHDTTIQMPKKLETIYSDYANKYDESILANLDPVQMIKMFYYTHITADPTTRYTMYIQQPLDRETYLQNVEKQAILKQEEQLFNHLAETISIQLEYLSEDEVQLTITHPDELLAPILLTKDPLTHVWKIDWISIHGSE